jgi:hypothetical protein
MHVKLQIIKYVPRNIQGIIGNVLQNPRNVHVIVGNVQLNQTELLKSMEFLGKENTM